MLPRPAGKNDDYTYLSLTPQPRELTSLVPAGVDTARQRIRELEVELIARNNRIAELQNEINKRASVTPSPFSETEQPEQLAPQAPQVRRARPCSRSQPGPSVVAMAQLLLRWLGPANGGLADIYDQIFREWLLINPVARQVAASRDRNVRNVKIGWRTREFAVMLSEEWDGTLRLSEEANWVMDAIISGMKRYVPDEFHPTNRTFHTRLRRLRECHTIVFESRDGLQTVANLLSEFFKFEGDNGGIMGERGRRILNSVCKGAPEECDILHGVQTVIFTENVLLDLLSLWKRKDTDEEYDDKAAMLSYYLSPTGACFQRPSLVSDEDEEMTAIIKQLSMLWPLESIVQHNVTQLFEPLVHPRQRLFLSRPWGPPDGPPETLYLRRVDGVQDVDIDLMSINGPLEFKAVTALGDVVDNTGCVFRSPRPFVMFDIQYTPYIRETGASCAFCGNR